MSRKARSIFLIFFSVVSGVIAICCLLVGYVPNRLHNERLQLTTCKQFCNVKEYWCRRETLIKSQCFDVRENVKPTNATCWLSVRIATFLNKAEAEKYASECPVFSFACFMDPNNQCKYYDSYDDVTANFIVGIIFASTCFLLAAAEVWCRCASNYRRRQMSFS